MLQVEHRTTERLTEQIERRVGSDSNSLDEISVGSSKESEKNTEEKRANKPAPSEQFPKSRPDLNVSVSYLIFHFRLKMSVSKMISLAKALCILRAFFFKLISWH